MVRRVQGAGNPEYGTGCYRRGIRLRRIDETTVAGELFDDFHAMAATLRHDGETVTAVEPAMVRVPTTMCGGAEAPARALAGTRLDVPLGDFFGDRRPNANCSHLFDLVWLLIRFAGRGEAERRYDVELPDHVGPGPARATLRRDGAVMLEWWIEGDAIVAPDPYAGRKILSGLVRWARGALDQEALEAAMILQKGFMVSRARLFSDRQLNGPLMGEDEVMRGTCFAYTSPRFEVAVRTCSRRDLSARESLETFG